MATPPTAASIAFGGYLSRTGDPARPTKCGGSLSRWARRDRFFPTRGGFDFLVASLRELFRDGIERAAQSGGS
ncbi:MAG: hypothetical protein L3J97_08105, partial [Thermoplasmata archaeon]|nr:hypothetical protein [Thermoplasmata archaeon]